MKITITLDTNTGLVTAKASKRTPDGMAELAMLAARNITAAAGKELGLSYSKCTVTVGRENMAELVRAAV